MNKPKAFYFEHEGAEVVLPIQRIDRVGVADGRICIHSGTARYELDAGTFPGKTLARYLTGDLLFDRIVLTDVPDILASCRVCKHDVESMAELCPECGAAQPGVPF